MKAICHLSMIPVRKDSSDRSEMVSQLLFGEAVEIFESYKNWYRVRMLFDDYPGWVDQKQVQVIRDEEFEKIKSSPLVVSTDLLQIATFDTASLCTLAIGSTIPHFSDGKFAFASTEYAYGGNYEVLNKKSPEKIMEYAHLYTNAPYLWGGRSPFGLDCSGFTQMVFKLCGYRLHRDASMQSEQGEIINLASEAQTGDLAFFDNDEGKIVHVGIILGDSHIIHCSGNVHTDRFDHQGIYSEQMKKYSHNLRTIKRML